MWTKLSLAALAAAALALPAAAAAQPYYGGDNRPYGGQTYSPPRGDYASRWTGRFAGYPEFRGIEAHIRGEIQQSVREDLIEPEDARDLFGELRDIQREEAREFRTHGWSLPQEDRDQLRAELQQLDQEVDEVRAEPEG